MLKKSEVLTGMKEVPIKKIPLFQPMLGCLRSKNNAHWYGKFHENPTMSDSFFFFFLKKYFSQSCFILSPALPIIQTDTPVYFSCGINPWVL